MKPFSRSAPIVSCSPSSPSRASVARQILRGRRTAAPSAAPAEAGRRQRRRQRRCSARTGGQPPVPPGPGDLPPPSGTPGNLKVLDWAGFKSAVTYTFDDAQPSQVEHYAELQATGVRHTFYITGSSTRAASMRRSRRR